MAKKTGKLTRADLDRIVDGMSARDVFRASSNGTGTEDEGGTRRAEDIFDFAAERQGYGEKALDRVPISETGYLGTLLSEALNVGGPKADSTGESLDSAGTGDSARS